MNSSLRIQRKHHERGSALLVSLMVMVGLSLLGLAFVAISETENAIAVNERNYVQAQTAAEAGANAVVEMFQDADWALDRKILPPNSPAIKTLRKYAAATSDYYKPSASMKMFSFPFKGSSVQRFSGSEETADVWIDASRGKVATDYLAQLNAVLFTDPTLRISSILVYAPPMPGATLNAWKFWEGGARYGVATIRVTGQKVVDSKVVAERTIKTVIAETPFPTVDGAIETSGSLVGQGNFQVYWGKVLSEKDLQLARPAVGMPWIDANDHLWYNYGWDSTVERQQDFDYTVGTRVHPPAANLVSIPDLRKFSYTATAVAGKTKASLTDPTEWPLAVGGSFVDGGVTWVAEPSRPYPIDGGDFATRALWLYALLGQTLEDPWLHARSRGAMVYDNNKTVPCSAPTIPHPCDYNDELQDVQSRYSNFFQLQTTHDPLTEREEVFFPTMEYEFWKAVAKSGNNSVKSGIYYFKYAGDGKTNLFQGPGGKVKDIEEWLNSYPGSNGKPQNGLQPGFYFFDTQNSKNPQFNKGGILTPKITINAGVKTKWQMRGYIYLNAEAFGTTGQGNIAVDDVYNMPGEPYRDIGYRVVDPDTKKYVLVGGAALPDADFKVEGANNDIHDCQEINNNSLCDVYVSETPASLTRPDGTPVVAYLPVPWFEGCTPGPNSDPKANCSEPQEPFLNLMYPAQNNPKGTLTVGWYDPKSIVNTNRRPKVATGTNTTVSCTMASTVTECTSNAWDEDGALVTFAPLLVGALYNEGAYEGSGNATYYGSLLMRGSFDSTGTPDVFFNECLARGCLEKQLKMQRVMVTSIEIDQ